jgi:AcrR family transcriptional regulator
MNTNGKPKQVRNKELTKRKLIDAVGEILRKDGYAGLGVNKVAKQAGVTKKLIYDYFKGNFNNLIEAYILETDYWMMFEDKVKELTERHEFSDHQKLITDILQNQFRYFYQDKEFQQLILWELTTKSPMMRSIHNARESMGQQLFELTDPHFEGSGVKFRAVAALLVSGIYTIVLHTVHNGSKFSDIDIATEQGKEDIANAIEMIVGWAYQVKNSLPDKQTK